MLLHCITPIYFFLSFMKVSETSNIEASVSKSQEEIENIVVTSPASVGIEAGKEYPQVHTNETKVPEEVGSYYISISFLNFHFVPFWTVTCKLS